MNHTPQMTLPVPRAIEPVLQNSFNALQKRTQTVQVSAFYSNALKNASFLLFIASLQPFEQPLFIASFLVSLFLFCTVFFYQKKSLKAQQLQWDLFSYHVQHYVSEHAQHSVQDYPYAALGSKKVHQMSFITQSSLPLFFWAFYFHHQSKTQNQVPLNT